jgi:hypothetical protein
MMNDRTKRELLESIIRSEKILNAFEKYRSNYKLNKKLMIERILEELDTLLERFKDISKLKKFLETFLSNHIKDFLIKNRSPSNRSENVSIQEDSRIDVDPNERLQRELEERRKMNSSIPMKKLPEIDETNESFTNEENIEEKNGSFDKDPNMNNRNQMNQMNQMNPNMLPQTNMMQQQQYAQQNMQQGSQFPPQNMQQQPQFAQQNMQQPSQFPPQNMQPQQFAQQNMMQQNMQYQPNMQPQPNMSQQQFAQQNMIPQQMNRMNQPPQLQAQQMQAQQMQAQQMQAQQMQPQHKQYMKKMEASPEQHMSHLKQKTIDDTPKPMPPHQQLAQVAPQTPQQNAQLAQTLPPHQQLAQVVPQVAQVPPQTVQQKEVQERSLIDRSVIHIDSRERNLQEHVKSNPFSVEMSDDMTCLISIRDMVLSNLTNDPYLLVQISEYKNSLYENQLNCNIHYKMIRKSKDEDYSYYTNTDPETMIRLRNISRITFQIIRPNGKLLYSSVQDVCDVKVSTEEEKKEYLSTVSSLADMDEDKLEVVEMSMESLERDDTLTLFEETVDKGDELRVIHMDRKNKKLVLEYMDGKTSETYQKAMIHKFQLSISLEII